MTESTILVLAPTGQDAQLISAALSSQGMYNQTVGSLAEMTEILTHEEPGALLIAEEALQPEAMSPFMSVLSAQPKWSDIPIVLMTGSGEATRSSLQMLNLFTASGNVNLLERPCRSVTLASVAKVALRTRAKQFEVKKLLRELAASIQQRDDFLSIASHELKTPLTSLKLQTQLSERSLVKGALTGSTPEMLKKLLSSTGRQLDRLTRLVEDMLDVSRISTGKLSITPEEMDLSELISELVERFSPQLMEAGCVLSLEARPGAIGYWDRYRLEQVVSNLLSNAIKHSTGKPVYVSLADEGDAVTLSVRDEGPGIAEADQGRIFNRFERAVNSNSVSGLGLGLYISRQIVEEHGGRILVRSVLGQGSCFSVWLPKAISVSRDLSS